MRGPWTSNIGIMWEVARNAKFLPHQKCPPGDSGECSSVTLFGLVILCFCKWSHWSPCRAEVGNGGRCQGSRPPIHSCLAVESSGPALHGVSWVTAPILPLLQCQNAHRRHTKCVSGTLAKQGHPPMVFLFGKNLMLDVFQKTFKSFS